jgi:hypothetical protein
MCKDLLCDSCQEKLRQSIHREVASSNIKLAFQYLKSLEQDIANLKRIIHSELMKEL